MTIQTSSEVEPFPVKPTCSRDGCDEPQASGRYCREHRNEYQREWNHRRTAELRALRAETRVAELELEVDRLRTLLAKSDGGTPPGEVPPS